MSRSSILIVAALVVLWVYNSLYMVQPDELGQELVFGKPKDEVSTQGLHFHLLAGRDGGERADPRAARVPRLRRRNRRNSDGYAT